MGDYGEWSPCTKECGGGTQIRTREIIQQAENNGTACGQQPLSENRTCNVHDCAGTNSISNQSLNRIVKGNFKYLFIHMSILQRVIFS